MKCPLLLVQINLISRYCNDSTIKRSNQLYESKSAKVFSDQIERKLRPLLLLKEFFDTSTGQAHTAPSVYSGYDIVIKSCDGNPRKLIKLFNKLIIAATNDSGFKPLQASQQGRILRNFSDSELESIKVEENGFNTYEFLNILGTFFKHNLHNEKIGTEIPLSFEFDLDNPEMWKSVKSAVDIGLLLPQITASGDSDHMPQMGGIFQLAGCISPHFFLPIRRGTSLKLSTILLRLNQNPTRPKSFLTRNQMELFSE